MANIGCDQRNASFQTVVQERYGIQKSDCTEVEGERQGKTAKTSFAAAVTNASKAEAIIIMLRQLMEGKTKPKDVMMPVRAAIEAGAIRRPTWEEFCAEFGKNRVRQKSSFSNYTNPDNNPYMGADFELLKEQFRELL